MSHVSATLLALATLVVGGVAIAQTPGAPDSGPTDPEMAPRGASRVELDPREITVGDRVTATVILVWDGAEPAETPRFPAYQETWGRAEVLEVGEVASSVQGDRHVYRQEIVLTAFETGEVTLPPLEIRIPLGGETASVRTPGDVALQVRSVLPPPPPEATEGGDAATGGDAPQTIEPRPQAPPQPLRGGSLFWWTAGALALACAASLVHLDRRLARAPTTDAAGRPLLSPFEELEQALVRTDAAEPILAHTAISSSLRRFLGRRLGFPALESTTSEIRRRLRGTKVGPETARNLLDLLRTCDTVKFAPRTAAGPDVDVIGPDVTVTGQRLERAKRLALDVEDALRPPPLEVSESSRRAAA